MKKLFVAGLALLSSSVFASSHSSTNIERVMTGPAYPGLAFVKVNPEPTDKAACNTDNLYTYVFDVSTPEGQAALSSILVAYTSNKTVWIGGNATCTQYSGVENLSYVVVQ